MALTERLAIIVDAAVGGAVRGLKDVSKASADLDDATGKSAAQMRILEARSEAAKNTLRSGLAVAAGVAGAALIAGFAAAAGEARKFDKAMSGVGAVANATAGEMTLLRSAALQAGKDTAFSATEAAKAEAELAKAGVAVKDILGGGLTGALSLAAAGQIELADAATIAAQAMNVFDLAGSDVAHVADVLAAAANKSAGDVKSLGDGLRQGGLIAKQTGLSLEDTVGALALFADNALVGSDAGTSLKTMLMRFIPTSNEARGKMDELGISFFDAAGEFIGLEAAAGVLKARLSGLSSEQRGLALNTIFGSDAARAAGVLYEAGAAGIRDYTKAVNDNGAAARMAAEQMDNLDGDLEQLSGSIETALIKGGSSATGVLRFLAQSANDAVGAFIALPGPVQSAATIIAGVGGAGLLAVAGFGLLVPKIREARLALDQMGGAAARANTALGVIGRFGGYAAGLMAVVGALDLATEAFSKARHGTVSLGGLADAMIDFGREGRVGGELAKQFGADFENLGAKVSAATRKLNPIGPLKLIGGVGDAKKDMAALDQTLATMVAGGHLDAVQGMWERLKTTLSDQGGDVADLNRLFGKTREAIANVSAEQKLQTKATVESSATMSIWEAALKQAGLTHKNFVEQARITSRGLIEALTAGMDPQAAEDFVKQFDSLQKQLTEKLDISAAWAKLEEDGKASLANLRTSLQGSINDVEKWRTDLNSVAARGGIEFAEQLEKLGPNSASLVAKIASASGPEFEKTKELFRKTGEMSGTAFAASLWIGMRAAAAIAGAGGKASAEAIATSIGVNTPQVVAMVESMARQMGVALAQNPLKVQPALDAAPLNASLNALRQWLGLQTIAGPKVTPNIPKHLMFADGGIFNKATAGVFGEAGPEAIIPLSRSKRGRAMDLLVQGGLLPAFANGGIAGQVPAASSTTIGGHSVSIRIDTVNIRANSYAEGQLAGRGLMDELIKLNKDAGAIPITVDVARRVAG